jgi:hypothetical protein
MTLCPSGACVSSVLVVMGRVNGRGGTQAQRGILTSGQVGKTCPSGGYLCTNMLCANHVLQCS